MDAYTYTRDEIQSEARSLLRQVRHRCWPHNYLMRTLDTWSIRVQPTGRVSLVVSCSASRCGCSATIQGAL